MSSPISQAEAKRRLSVAAVIAERFGVDAPYPGAIVRGKYAARMDREKRFDAVLTKLETLLAEAAHGRSKVKDLDRCYRALRAALVHRDRMKLPGPYLSWAHIAAFLQPITNGDHNDVEDLRNLLRRGREERERELELIRVRPRIYQHLQR